MYQVFNALTKISLLVIAVALTIGCPDPPPDPTPESPPNILLDFNSDPAESDISIVTSGDWEWGVPSITYGENPTFFDQGCFGTNLNGVYSENTSYDTNNLRIGPIDLSSYDNTLELRFQFYLVLEGYIDTARVEISKDGSNFSVLEMLTPEYNDQFSPVHKDEWKDSEDFHKKTEGRASLSEYAGEKSCYIRFALRSDGAPYNSGPGFYVDNVEIGTFQ